MIQCKGQISIFDLIEQHQIHKVGITKPSDHHTTSRNSICSEGVNGIEREKFKDYRIKINVL